MELCATAQLPDTRTPAGPCGTHQQCKLTTQCIEDTSTCSLAALVMCLVCKIQPCLSTHAQPLTMQSLCCSTQSCDHICTAVTGSISLPGSGPDNASLLCRQDIVCSMSSPPQLWQSAFWTDLQPGNTSRSTLPFVDACNTSVS